MPRGAKRAAATPAEPVVGPWELPDGWRWERLGTALPLAYGKALPEKLRDASGDVPVYGSSGVVGRHVDALTSGPAVLVGRKGSAGAVHLSENPCWPIDTAYFVLPRDGIDLRYGYRLLQHLRLGDLDQSTAIPSLSRDIYSEVPAPFPPLDVQRRIVARIDALFAEIEEGEQALAAAREGVETYRKALLKAAVTGELTADWRKANPATEAGQDLLRRILADRRARWEASPRNRGKKYVEPNTPDTDDLPDLPEGWTWASVEAVGEVQLGRQRAPQHHSGDDMRPYLRVANVLEGCLDLRDVKKMNFTRDEYEVFSLRSGDVLLNEGQAPDLIGRPAIYRDEVDGCCFQKTLLRFRAGDFVDPEFALIVYRQYMRSGRFKREARITTNIGHLTQVRFAPMEFPAPPIAEQQEIVRIIEKGEGGVSELPLDAAEISELRQSILAAAFRGELGPA